MEVKSFLQFEHLPSACNALFESAAAESPFLSREWFEHLAANALDPGDEIVLIVAFTNEGEAACILPLLRPGSSAHLVSIKRLGALQNFYTPDFRPLMRAGVAGVEGMAAIAHYLSSRCCSIDVVDIGPIPKDESAFEIYQKAVNEAGFSSKAYFRFGNHYLLLKGQSYKAYMSELPSQLRHTLVRKGRRLDREKTVEYRLVTELADVPAAAQAYDVIYRESWKRPEPYPDFMEGLMAMAADKGWLRLGLLCIDGEPAASHLWFISGDIAYIYKLAYRERYQKYSPGTLLMGWMMEQAIDKEGVHKVDFLTGDDRYKSDWMSHRSELWGILAMNQGTWCGKAIALREKLYSYAAGKMRADVRQI
ncbi:MAG: GNAT family N-acetyltransferase [Candidatus Polarisedimenticolaceae bacterium]|nr:GNAT family N-acetyltransferase [Candidatus Polarisedimenticolaceae bacterium]